MHWRRWSAIANYWRKAMSDALEALSIIKQALSGEFGGGTHYEKYLLPSINTIRAALEQGEQGEAVEYWVLFDASGGRKFIKKEVGSGVLAFFDDEFAAKAAKRANPGTDYQKVVYYKAPPSTAEVKAQATELALWLVMDEWEANLDDWTAEGIKNTLLSEAKRLREEG